MNTGTFIKEDFTTVIPNDLEGEREMTKEEWESSYQSQRPFADRFTPRLIGLLATSLDVPTEQIRISTEDEDIRDGADVVIYNQFRFGLRVRTYHQLQKYGHQVTIRLVKNRFGETEVDKIRQGKIDGFIYAFADEDSSASGSASDGLSCWSLLRADAIRLALERDPRFADVTCQCKHSQHCDFLAFDLDSFPEGTLVIARDCPA